MKKKIKTLPRCFDFPSEVLSGCPKITLIGVERMLVENHNGIFAITQSVIRIITKQGLLEVSGHELIIKELNDDCLIIEGIIQGCKFESKLSN